MARLRRGAVLRFIAVIALAFPLSAALFLVNEKAEPILSTALLRAGATTTPELAPRFDPDASLDDIERAAPEISCTVDLYGKDPKKQGDYRCSFTFAADDPVARDLRSGRLDFSSIQLRFLPERDIKFERDPTTPPTLVDDGRRLRVESEGTIKVKPLNPAHVVRLHGVGEVSREIAWTFRTHDLLVTGVDGDVEFTELNGSTAVFRTRTDRAVSVVVDGTPATSSEAYTWLYGYPQVTDQVLEREYRLIPYEVAALVPFLLFLALTRQRFEYFHSRVRPVVTAVVVIAVVQEYAQQLLSDRYSYAFWGSPLLEGLLWFVAPVVLIAVSRASAGLPPLPRAGGGVYATLAGLIVLALVLPAALVGGSHGVTVLWSAAVAGVLGWAVTFALGGQRWLVPSLVFAVGGVAAAGLIPVVDAAYDMFMAVRLHGAFGLVIQVAAGIPLAALTWHVARGLGERLLIPRIALTMVALVSTVSLPNFFETAPQDVSPLLGIGIGSAVGVWVVFSGFLMLLLLLTGIRAEAASGVAYRDSSALLVLTVASSVLIVGAFPPGGAYSTIVAQLLLPFLFMLLIRHRLTAGADRLAGVRPAVHRRLVRAEIKRRTAARHLTALLHAPSRTSADDATVGDVMADIGKLEHAEGAGRSVKPGYVDLTTAALGGSAGAHRVDNLKTGALYGFVLSLPVAVFEIIIAWRSGNPIDPSAYETIYFLSVIKVLFRGVAFGALAGYYYPLLRGWNPIAKCAALLGVVAVADAVSFIDALDGTGDRLITTLIRLGVQVVLFLVLGLLWERRLMVLAGVPWVRLRDFRSVRALATPVTTILVAAATVLATALATAAVAPMIKQPPAVESPTGDPAGR